MKRMLVSTCLSFAAVFTIGAAVELPVSGVSVEDATVDTMWGDFLTESVDRSLDTVLFDWALSPFPGIRLNTKELKGLFLLVK